MDEINTTQWKQLETTPPHLTYLILSLFLLSYALFTKFIRNVLHLSEPPLAVLVGIILGPVVAGVITPREWGLEDEIMQEITRVIVGIQCFAVGVELPKFYLHRHWRSLLMMLGPIMAFGWLIVAAFACLIFKCSLPTALVIAACLTPTDPVLAASVLAQSKFSNRVPKRLKNLLSAESACNDGVSFPFLYVGLVIYTETSALSSFKEWIFITVLYQCVGGIVAGLLLGNLANRALRKVSAHDLIGTPSFVVFYLLMATLAIGLGSTLGSDDFLVAFGAGIGFAHDGWFSKKTGRKQESFAEIIDLMLNSTMFVYFGSDIPWSSFVPRDVTPYVGPWRLALFLVLVLLFRRIPVVLALKQFIPDIKTYREAWFCGHFGPMGVGALFLAIEARAQLETGESIPLPHPIHEHPPFSERYEAIELLWPIVCFVVLGSTMVHGLSVAVISVIGSYQRHEHERAPLLGGETEGLHGMNHDEGDTDSEPEASGSEIEH